MNGLRGFKVAIANPMPVTVINHFFAIVINSDLVSRILGSGGTLSGGCSDTISPPMPANDCDAYCNALSLHFIWR